MILTGWDRKDDSVLKARPATVVPKMANPEVTDQPLDFLMGMSHLKELDLDQSKLAKLPTLETLKLKDTRITDAGFGKSLAGPERIRQLDLRGTQVTRESCQARKAARSGRRSLQ